MVTMSRKASSTGTLNFRTAPVSLLCSITNSHSSMHILVAAYDDGQTSDPVVLFTWSRRVG